MAYVLIVDDEGAMRALLAMALEREGYEIAQAADAEEALAKLEEREVDVVVTDIRLPGLSGIDLLRKAKQRYISTEWIVMTAYADARSGIDAMRAGAIEYVSKPFEMDEMLLLVRTARDTALLRRQADTIHAFEAPQFSFERIIGNSTALQETICQARIVAPRSTTVLICGPSGSGKELIARGIHGQSGRSPFVALNCAALPDTLLESQLFGHEKGAFTGAHARSIGVFEQAGNGTLFLDEIGDISPSLQAKLLRILQEREFCRLGSAATLKAGARVIAATNRDLDHAVHTGVFREDLYYRLNTFPIHVPALRERAEDIPLLVEAFCRALDHQSGCAPGTLDLLTRYAWPGNVRELQHCVERAVIIASDSPIEPRHIPDHIRGGTSNAAAAVRLPQQGVSLDEVERSLIIQALERTGGNKAEAARLLGISRRAMYSRMKTHGIEDTPERGN